MRGLDLVLDRLGRMREELFSDGDLDSLYKNPDIASDIHVVNTGFLRKELKRLARGEAEYTVAENLRDKADKKLDGAVILRGHVYPRQGDVYIDSEIANDEYRKFYTYAHECVHKYMPQVKQEQDSVIDFWLDKYLKYLVNDKDSEVAVAARKTYKGLLDKQKERQKGFGSVLGGDGSYTPDFRYNKGQSSGGYSDEDMVDRVMDAVFSIPKFIEGNVIRTFLSNYGLDVEKKPGVSDFVASWPKYGFRKWQRAMKKEEEGS